MDPILVELIGTGAFGTVWKATSGNQGVAVKILPSSDAACAEANILKMMHHPGIIELIDVLRVGSNVWIVMQLKEGSLRSNEIQAMLSKEPCVLKNATGQLLRALNHMYERKIVHGDIKPDNILYKRVLTNGKTDIVVTIGDWGSAAYIKNNETSNNVVGTPLYMAPEALRGESLNPSQDLYSLFMTLVEIITGKHPIQSPEMNTEVALFRARRINRINLRDEIVAELMNLLPSKWVDEFKMCLNPIRSERPLPSQVLDRLFAVCRELFKLFP